MKKILPPLIVFAGAFLGTLLLQKNCFVMQEYDGLFLLSGDYFSAMLRTPFPVSGIIGDFLTQFFRFGVYAPLIGTFRLGDERDDRKLQRTLGISEITANRIL